MRKCPSCGRNYSDMVQVCPACNITLDESTSTPKSAAEERPREERKETVVREERVMQKETEKKSTKNTSPASVSKGPLLLVGVVGLVILFGIMFYMNSQTKAKQAVAERTQTVEQTAESQEKEWVSVPKNGVEVQINGETITGDLQMVFWAEDGIRAVGSPDVTDHGVIVARYLLNNNLTLCVVFPEDVQSGSGFLESRYYMTIDDTANGSAWFYKSDEEGEYEIQCNGDRHYGMIWTTKNFTNMEVPYVAFDYSIMDRFLTSRYTAFANMNGVWVGATMINGVEVQNDKIHTDYEGKDFCYGVTIKGDITPGEYCLDENNGLEVYRKNDGNWELFSEDCTTENGFLLRINERTEHSNGMTTIKGVFLLNAADSQMGISELYFSTDVPTYKLP